MGGRGLGRPVIGPDLIQDSGIRHVALSMSPVYAGQVFARLRSLGVNVYMGHDPQ